MRIKIWGARGSVPAPGPETMHYGGNTSCVEVTLSDGSTLILDAGTGIRNLGLALPRVERPIHILPLVRRIAELENRLPIELTDSADAQVEADPDQLEQLLINIVRNAVDAFGWPHLCDPLGSFHHRTVGHSQEHEAVGRQAQAAA